MNMTSARKQNPFFYLPLRDTLLEISWLGAALAFALLQFPLELFNPVCHLVHWRPAL